MYKQRSEGHKDAEVDGTGHEWGVWNSPMKAIDKRTSRLELQNVNGAGHLSESTILCLRGLCGGGPKLSQSKQEATLGGLDARVKRRRCVALHDVIHPAHDCKTQNISRIFGIRKGLL